MKNKGFMSNFYDKCLFYSHKIRHSIILFLVQALLVACGKTYTYSTSSMTSGLNLMMIENRCFNSSPTPEVITKEINETYYSFIRAYPLSLLTIPFKNYDHNNPLIINTKSMEIELRHLQKEIRQEYLSSESIKKIGEDLFDLNNQIIRYEAQKCSFKELAKKKNAHVDSFLKLSELCYAKNKSYHCEVNSLKNLSVSESQKVEDWTTNICQALGNDPFLCRQEIGIGKKKKSLTALISKLFFRYKSEQFNKLFLLKDSRLRFSCTKSDEKVEMHINVKFDMNFQNDKMELADFISESWSNEQFKLNLYLNDEINNYKTVQVKASKNRLSSVPLNDQLTILLSTQLSPLEQRRILAHEFGHVLGFPDCYTEYYDAQNKNLVYFEMGEENFNLMCSVKLGTRAPTDYIDQLKLNSCNF